jgi:hypothetical protein
VSIKNLRERADRLASEARSLRLERDRRAAESLDLARRRISSPAGLALCFGAGFAVGHRSPKRAAHGSGDGVAKQAARLLERPLGAAAVKLAVAFIAGAVARPDRQGDSPQPTSGGAASHRARSGAGPQTVVPIAAPGDGSSVK